MGFRTYKQLFQRALVKRGQRKTDAQAATSLAWLMMVYDGKVFQAPSLPVHYITSSDRMQGVAAAYRPADDDGAEAYLVHVPGMSSWLSEARSYQIVFVVSEEDYQSVEREGSKIPASWMQMLASLAAHEVRHHVQAKRPSLRRFMPAGCTTDKSILEGAWRICAANWSRRCRAIIASDLDSAVKASQMSLDEFDAWVIGTAVLNAIRAGASVDDIVGLITQDAPV